MLWCGRLNFDRAQCGKERHRGNMLVWPSGNKSRKHGDVHIRLYYYLYQAAATHNMSLGVTDSFDPEIQGQVATPVALVQT